MSVVPRVAHRAGLCSSERHILTNFFRGSVIGYSPYALRLDLGNMTGEHVQA
jgi:hypothetical protein